VAYFTSHHGTYWFQIRVPKNLQHHYGALVRINLQTPVRAEAQRLSYRLAGDWLDRFASASMDNLTLHPISHVQTGLEVALPCAPPEAINYLTPTFDLPVPSTNKKQQIESLDDLFVYWKQLNPERPASTISEVKKVITEFKKHIRALKIHQIQRQHLIAFRDFLIQQRLARSTIRNKIGYIASLLQVGFDAGILPENIGRGIRIPKSKAEASARRPFTVKELETIFASPIYAINFRPRGGGHEACVWLPMIALATGARLEEISQLRVDDIEEDPKHGLLIRITDEGSDQRVKTAGSRRTIPVHQELLCAGFRAYWHDQHIRGEAWLFPSLEPDHDGRRGGAFGQWFSRYLRGDRGCKILDKRVVFHSFRHTFKTLCREAGISEEVHDALTGHVSGSIGRTYGHMPLAPLVEAIGQLKLPVAFPVVTND
jgi:integrase